MAKKLIGLREQWSKHTDPKRFDDEVALKTQWGQAARVARAARRIGSERSLTDTSNSFSGWARSSSRRASDWTLC